MADRQVVGAKWLIKLAKGKIKGPFSTREILDKISSRDMTGEEEVALYPTQNWMPLSNEPEFYDQLLAILEKDYPKIDEELDESQLSLGEEIAQQKARPISLENQKDDAQGAVHKDPDNNQLGSKKNDEGEIYSEEAEQQGSSAEPDLSLEETQIDTQFLNLVKEKAQAEEAQKASQSSAQMSGEEEANGKIQNTKALATIENSDALVATPDQNEKIKDLIAKLQTDDKSLQIGVKHPGKLKNIASNGMDDSSSKEATKRRQKKVSDSKNLGMRLIIGAVLFFVLAFYFYQEGLKEEESKELQFVELLMPGKTQVELPEAEVKKRLELAYYAFNQDDFQTLLLAQEGLIEAIEAQPKALEQRELLCLVYKNLWPFTLQGLREHKILTEFTRRTKEISLRSKEGHTCEMVKLYLTGKNKEAKQLLDLMLQEENGRYYPFYHQMKVEFSLAEKKYLEAFEGVLTLESLVQKSVPLKYLKAKVFEARGEFDKAAQEYTALLTFNPTHKASLIELGVYTFEKQKKPEQAMALLKKALQQKETLVSKKLEAKGYYVVAQIYLHQNDSLMALGAATMAYRLHRSNRNYEQFFLQLGGIKKDLPLRREQIEMVWIGDEYARNGDCFAAQAEYKAAFDLDPSNALAATKAAVCLWQLNQSKEAIEYLKKAISAKSNYVEPYLHLAEYLAEKYEFEEASRTLSIARALESDNPDVYKAMAKVEIKRNSFVLAETHARRALQLFESDSESFLLLAEAEFGNSKWTESSASVNKAIELNPSLSAAHVLNSKIIFQLQGFSFANNYLTEVMRSSGGNTDLLIGLAELNMKQDRFIDAEKFWNAAVARDPNNKKARIGLADAIRGQGRLDDAVLKYLEAAVVDPSDGKALFQAGILYFDNGNFNNAIKQFKRVLEVSPKFPLAHYLIGKAFFQMKDYASAIEFANLEKKINPNMAEAYLLAAESFLLTNQFPKCIEEYQIASKMQTYGAEVYVKMARCYRLEGNIEIAKNMLTIAEGRESGNPELWLELAFVYECELSRSEAVGAYEKYLGLSPNAKDAAEVQAQIDKLNSGLPLPQVPCGQEGK